MGPYEVTEARPSRPSRQKAGNIRRCCQHEWEANHLQGLSSSSRRVQSRMHHMQLIASNQSAAVPRLGRVRLRGGKSEGTRPR